MLDLLSASVEVQQLLLAEEEEEVGGWRVEVGDTRERWREQNNIILVVFWQVNASLLQSFIHEHACIYLI